MLNKKQIGALLIIVIIFSTIGYFSWKYQNEISNFVLDLRGVKDEDEESLQEVINNQEESEDENVYNISQKNNPEEITVTPRENGDLFLSSEFGNYSFVLPKDWEGVERIVYEGPHGFEQYILFSTFIFRQDSDELLRITKFENEISDDVNLKTWVEKLLMAVNQPDVKVEDIDIPGYDSVIIERETEPRIYFKGESCIYIINNSDIEELKEIVMNGKWEGEPSEPKIQGDGLLIEK